MTVAAGAPKQQQQQQQQPAASAAAGLPGCLLRRLQVLRCPLVSVGLTSPHFEDCVWWLEETHIRCLSRQQRREQLAQRDARWWNRFIAYSCEAGIETQGVETDSSASRLSLLQRLIGLALKYSYQDAIADSLLKGSEESQDQQDEKRKKQQQQQQQELDDLVKALRAPLAEALEALSLPPLEADASPAKTLAALKAIEARVCAASADGLEGGSSSLSVKETVSLLQQLPLLLGPRIGKAAGGKEAGDWERQFAAALRVLHAMRLQETQNQIDEALERMQLLTADPKTDHRLARRLSFLSCSETRAGSMACLETPAAAATAAVAAAAEETAAESWRALLPSRDALQAALRQHPPTHSFYLSYGTSGKEAQLAGCCVLGAVITASHNPGGDNGLKLAGPTGCLLSAPLETLVEQLVNAHVVSKQQHKRQQQQQEACAEETLQREVDCFYATAEHILRNPHFAFVAGLLLLGCLPVSLGIASTGQLQFLVLLCNQALEGGPPLLQQQHHQQLLAALQPLLSTQQQQQEELEELGQQLVQFYFFYFESHFESLAEDLRKANLIKGTAAALVGAALLGAAQAATVYWCSDSSPLYVDFANGAGASAAAALQQLLQRQLNRRLDARNLGPLAQGCCCGSSSSGSSSCCCCSSPGVSNLINEGCGAEVVQKQQRLPQPRCCCFHVSSGYAGDTSEEGTCCSLDGDADRIVFYRWRRRPRSQEVELRVSDGDRIACLFLLLIVKVLKAAEEHKVRSSSICFQQQQQSPPLRIGLIQTAYANGGSTQFLQSLAREVATWRSPNLEIVLRCTGTGVKHLHREALQFPVSVYFEANGHGTVLHKETDLLQWAQRSGIQHTEAFSFLLHFLRLFNPATGDALCDLLAVEAAMLRLGLSLDQWFGLYEASPCVHTKVALPRNFLRTLKPEPSHEQWLLEPQQLQAQLDALTQTCGPFSRLFVRPSGTEDVARIYAECPDPKETERLAEAARLLVEDAAAEFAKQQQQQQQQLPCVSSTTLA
ncbi:hypothetical protein Esti_000652 [Eimeria stiedai]